MGITWKQGLALALIGAALGLAIGCSSSSDDNNQPPEFTLTSPNGGETWVIGDTMQVRWTCTDNEGTVRLEYQTGYPQGTWQTITGSAPNNGTYPWVVNAPISVATRVRISGIERGGTDESNGNFAVAEATLQIVSPNGGEIILSDKPADTIRWTSSNVTGNVSLEFNADYPAGQWQTLNANYPNNGALIYNPATIGQTSRARVRITSLNRPGVRDESDGDFTVEVPRLTITAPVDGPLIVGDTVEVRWTSNFAGGRISIDISTGGISDTMTWVQVARGASNSGLYRWLVNLQTSGARRHLRIYTPDHAAAVDTSNGLQVVPQWTVLAYCAGNTAEDTEANVSRVILDVQSLESVGSRPGVEVLAMVSARQTNGAARVYHVEYRAEEPQNQITSPVLRALGVQDLSNAQVFTNYLQFAADNYPAARYLLLIDGVGGASQGCCLDDQGDGTLLTLPEIRTAIGSTLGHVNIAAFHARQMATVEVFDELRDVADYVVAGELNIVPRRMMAGLHWMNWLVQNPRRSTVEAARQMVTGIVVNAGDLGTPWHMAVLDVTRAQPVMDAITGLSAALLSEASSYWNEVSDARNRAWNATYDGTVHLDLAQFCTNLLEEPHLRDNQVMQSACNEVLAVLPLAVSYSDLFRRPDTPQARSGFSIYFPSLLNQFDSTGYSQLRFTETNWISFLSPFVRRQ